jgi:thiamine pyrophosphate-dependent acetolactate synthase large subunit-like protein
MTDPRVYEVLADSFLQETVDTCFALLGDANMNWASAMAERGCRFIYVRHEHCAVAAAMAFARSTGNPGIASVTCGPGLTQVMTALPAAVRARIPLLIFAGEAPIKSAWYNQGIDQKPFVDACGARYVALHHQRSMRQQLRDAFLLMRTERMPVVVGVPFDLQVELWSESLAPMTPSLDLMSEPQPIVPDQTALAAAARLIDTAGKVIVMAGLGAVEAGAGPACRMLAESTGALLATTLPAKGLFYEDPYSLGVAGGFSSDTARKYLSQADLIIAVGASLASHNSDSGKLFSADNVLQIDVDPKLIHQGRVTAATHLCCDAKAGGEALNASVANRRALAGDGSAQTGAAGAGYYWRSDAIAEEISGSAADSSHQSAEPGLLDPRQVVTVLDDVIPSAWYTVNSSGHCSCFFAQMKKRPASRFLTIREFGAIGNGLSFAMGVAAAHGAAEAREQEPVVLFDGDGSFLMHIQELETIVRHQLNILIVVINDGAYGSEVHKLRAEGLPEQGSVFGRPNFAAIAQSFGLYGETVNELSQLADVVRQFSKRRSATVIDVHVSDQIVSSVVRRSHPH